MLHGGTHSYLCPCLRMKQCSQMEVKISFPAVKCNSSNIIKLTGQNYIKYNLIK